MLFPSCFYTLSGGREVPGWVLHPLWASGKARRGRGSPWGACPREDPYSLLPIEARCSQACPLFPQGLASLQLLPASVPASVLRIGLSEIYRWWNLLWGN